MKNKFRAPSFTFKDIGGRDHIATFIGTCVVCGSRCYTVDNDEDPDPRRVIGPIHSSARLVARDHGMAGPDVILCYRCSQTRETYAQAIKIAREQWKKEEAKT